MWQSYRHTCVSRKTEKPVTTRTWFYRAVGYRRLGMQRQDFIFTFAREMAFISHKKTNDMYCFTRVFNSQG